MRPGREIDFRDKTAAFLRGGSPGKSTIRVHPSAKEGDHPGACVMCHCPEVSHSGLLRLAQQGHVRNPQSAVEELAIFVTYFFNDSKQTHLL